MTFHKLALPVGIALGILMLSAAQGGLCDKNDFDSTTPLVQLQTLACVDGRINVTIADSGGGSYLSPDAPLLGTTGTRSISGSDAGALSDTSRVAVMKIRPGREYSVTWTPTPFTEITSLHAVFTPKGMTSGSKFQVNTNNGEGWRDESSTGIGGAALANITTNNPAIHKFRILPPLMKAGEITPLALTQTRFAMGNNSAVNGLGLIGESDNYENNVSNPGFERAKARVFFGLGAVLEAGTPITAGRVVFESELWASSGLFNPQIRPSLLSYEGAGVGVTLRTDSSGSLRQVNAPSVLADVVTLSSSSFEVRMYSADQVTAPVIPGGLFTTAGPPISVARFSKPGAIAISGVGNSSHQVKVVHFEKGVQISEVEAGGANEFLGLSFAAIRKEGAESRIIQNEREAVQPNVDFEMGGFTYSLAARFYYRDEVETVRKSGVLVDKVERRYLLHSVGGFGINSPFGGFGDLLVKEAQYLSASISDPPTQYYQNYLQNPFPSHPPYTKSGFGKPAFRIDPDGSWERYFYDSQGRISKTLRPYKGLPLDPMSATDSNCVREEVSYQADPYSVPSNPPPGVLELAEILDGGRRSFINNVEVARQEISYVSVVIDGQPVLRKSQKDFSDATSYLTTITDTYHQSAPEHLRDKLLAVTSPSGERTGYNYQQGNFDSLTRVFVVGANGPDEQTTITTGTTASPEGVAHETMRRVIVRSADGKELQEKTEIFTGGSTYDTATTVDSYYDELGRLLRSERDGRIIEEQSVVGLVTTSTNEEGLTFVRTTNSMGEVVNEGKIGGLASVTTRTGLTTTRVQGGTLTSSRAVDFKGRPTSMSDVAGRITSYSYPNGGRDTETTYPGNLKVRITRYPGGRVQSETNVTGSRIVPTYQTETVNSDGTRTRRISMNSATSDRWSESKLDWLDRTIETKSPAARGIGTTSVIRSFDPVTGLLISETPSSNTGLKKRLYIYDSLGRLERGGIDFAANDDALTLASIDRVQDYETNYQKIADYWYRVESVTDYRENGSDTGTVVSLTKERLHGSGDGLASRFMQTDANGLTLTTERTIDRVNKTAVLTTSRSDASGVEERIHVNGLLQEVRGPTTHESYLYDAWDRLWKITNERSGAVTTRAYDAVTGQLESVRDHLGNLTQFFYYPAIHANAGLLNETRNALLQSSYFSYNERGQRTHEWGAAVHPSKRSYTAYGELETLTTYRGGSGWNLATWPTTTGTGDVTTWSYSAGSGLLESKADAENRAVTYTYHDNGAVHTRTTERFTTTYAYTDGTGLATGIAYNDPHTPDVTITHHRTGEAATITDGSGKRTLSYGPGGQLDAEVYGAGSVFEGLEIDRNFAANGAYDALDVNSGASSVLAVTREFHPDSALLKSVTEGATSARYRYLPHSRLLHQTTYSQSGDDQLVSSRRHDVLNRLESVAHFTAGFGGAHPVASGLLDYTGYQFDALNRRERATNGEGRFWDFSYTERGEIDTAIRKLPDGTLLAGQQWDYDFDTIGNLVGKKSGGDASGNNLRTMSAVPNALNQFGSISYPGSFDVLGHADPVAAVTINGQASQRQDNTFRGEVTASNASSNGVWQAVTVASGGLGSSGHKYLPPASFTPSYDLDGNPLEDGEWSYTWDAENRLTTATRTTRAQAAGAPYRRMEYDYDSQSRLYERQEFHGSTGPPLQTERYLYDGWNRILTLDGGNSVLQKMVWGSDASGTDQGAGGVGGLLWIEDEGAAQIHLVCVDGNGNITALVDAVTRVITARYDYNPFGEVIRQTGAYAAQNPFRFSTKPQDATTGLFYYGYRWFDSETCAWLGKDPLGEEGGLHLYLFVRNDSINGIDYLGMLTFGEWTGIIGESFAYMGTGEYWGEVGHNYAQVGKGIKNGAVGAVEGIANLPELAEFVASGEAVEMADRLRNDPAYQKEFAERMGAGFCQGTYT